MRLDGERGGVGGKLHGGVSRSCTVESLSRAQARSLSPKVRLYRSVCKAEGHGDHEHVEESLKKRLLARALAVPLRSLSEV